MHDDYNRSSRPHGDRDRGPRGGGGGRGGPGRGPDREGRGIPLSSLDPALTDVSRKLIGCAIEVHRNLGPGFEEAVYQKALEVELAAIGVAFASNHAIPVIYKGQQIGARIADMVIDNRFVVDLMATRHEIGGSERASVRSLLRAADMELGLIINFGERRLKDGLVRVLNPDKLNLPVEGEGHEEHGSGDVFDADAEPH